MRLVKVSSAARTSASGAAPIAFSFRFVHRREPSRRGTILSEATRSRAGPGAVGSVGVRIRVNSLTRRKDKLCYGSVLLPAQNTSPYMTPYETRSMRALAALRMVWASAAYIHAYIVDGGGDVGNVVCVESIKTPKPIVLETPRLPGAKCAAAGPGAVCWGRVCSWLARRSSARGCPRRHWGGGAAKRRERSRQPPCPRS